MRGIYIALDDPESPSDTQCTGCGAEFQLTDRVDVFGPARLHSRRQCRVEFAQRVSRLLLAAVDRDARPTLPGGGNVFAVTSEIS